MGITNNYLTSERDACIERLKSNLLYGAVGTGTTSFDGSQTALVSEVVRNLRTEADDSVTGKLTVSLTISSAQANGSALAENGWFDASSSGNMSIRNTNQVINKTSDIVLYMDTTIEVEVEEV